MLSTGVDTVRISRLIVAACAAALAVPACAPADPRSTDELIAEGRRLDLGGQHDEAVKLYRAALDREPESYDGHYGLARALDLTGKYEEARRHFARAIELAPEPEKDQPLRMMAIAWVFARDADRAASYFRQVFDRRIAAGAFAGASDVANEIGRVDLELGRLDAAETWYRTGYDTAARQADRPAWQVDLAELRWAHAQARIAARRGQAEAARRHTAAVRGLLDKGTNSDQEIHYPYLAGYVDLHLGDPASARSHLERADQEDPFILLLLAQASERLGDDSSAREYYRKMLASSSHGLPAALARPVAIERLKEAPASGG
jgi:tetratricopeptide (TPR) repeat protein